VKTYPDRYKTVSLNHIPVGDAIGRILAAAINAVDPYILVQNAFHYPQRQISVHRSKFNLSPHGKLILIGAGKASAAMGQGIIDRIGCDSISGGMIITKNGYIPQPTDTDTGNVIFVEAGHPVPDERGLNATTYLTQLVSGLNPDDQVICLLSGGGSSLLTRPAGNISLPDIQQLTDLLLLSGASIQELNTVRKHIDEIKGGGLARTIYPARLIVLVVSDVLGDPLDLIASGPCFPDPSTYSDALNILNKYEITHKTPKNIINHLNLGINHIFNEIPKIGDKIYSRVDHLILANVKTASRAAHRQACAEGFDASIITTNLTGEARQVGLELSHLARNRNHSWIPRGTPICLIFGGETTVSVKGLGRGGRNQEIALAAVQGLASLENTALLTLATDGGDGSTDAAGAVVTGLTAAKAHALGIDPARFLDDNDAYSFFDALGDLIKPGPTFTNVNDLVFLFLW